ncbi:MAG: phosphonoacetaldehyde reductase [Candidatus Neomarinimicrobiota bacterium]
MDSAKSRHSNPVKVITSDDWRSDCARALESLNVRNPLVVTTKGTVDRTGLVQVFPKVNIFPDVEPNPTFTSCQAAIDFGLGGEFDGVVAIGGGSPMDTAKAVMAALGTGKRALPELLAYSEPYPHKVPGIFMPTTHGTASEVTMWGTIWDMDEMRKHSIAHPDLYPSVAILDPDLCLSLPLDISLTTTLDALSHSLEAIWNRNATEESTRYAIDAVCAILANVPKLKDNLGDRSIRAALLKAANIAGLAFSQTKTAAAHSISYPLSLHYSIPHGIAASMTVLPLLEINQDHIRAALDAIMKRLGLDDLEQLRGRIRDIPGGYLKYRLREWGVAKTDLDTLAEESFASPRMANNIVALSQNDVRHILETIY